jgi:Transposase DDE domain
VCKNKRIHRYKTFAGLTTKEKSTIGYFFGLKLHLVYNTLVEIVAVNITAGNVDDRHAFEDIAQKHSLTRKCCAKNGFIRKYLFKTCDTRGYCLLLGLKKYEKFVLAPR